MKYTGILLVVVFGFSCSGGTHRNEAVVAAEEYERRKPLITPPGGVYYDRAEIRILNYSAGLEFSTSAAFSQLQSDTLEVANTASVTVRNAKQPELSSTESYTIVRDFPEIEASPAPGTFTHPVTITFKSVLLNSSIEIKTGDTFAPYDGETGFTVAETQILTVRQCVEFQCSPIQAFNYAINSSTINLPPRNLNTSEIARLADLAMHRYSQTEAAGLSTLMDEAKLRVTQNATLMPQAAMRQRFLSQDNTTSAAEACTIIARYLYTEARRITLGDRTLAELPDFPLYYIRHIVAGNITVDSGSRNYVWLAHGPALVTPYLPADATAPFEFSRGLSFPTDYSLIDRLYVQAPAITLLRDGPSGSSHTHTFVAMKAAAGYTMIDTYFAAFTGTELKASAGKSWPYAYRFGPAGSRYLHFVYGY